MKAKQKKWFISWWVISILIILIIGIIGGLFWKGNPETVNEYIENVIDSVKEIIGVQDLPSEKLNNNTELNNKSTKVTTNVSEEISISGGGGGGGGGVSGGVASESTEVIITPPVQYTGNETFSNLEDLFNYGNPVGNKVILRGIAIQISGVSMSEYFFFTDDSRVMDNPNYLLVNKIDYHTTIYNSAHISIPQSIIDIEGVVVNCAQSSHGTYCVNAESIE